MKLSLLCIRRPVFATVLSLALIVLGVIGYINLNLRYFPSVPQKFASVSVSYPGASPSLMQNAVTRYLENGLLNVKGIKRMRSSSSYGKSTVDLQFESDANMVAEMGLVRDAVSAQVQNLPTEAEPASITSGGVSDPVLNLGFLDNKLKPAQIRDYIVQSINPKLRHLPGVGAIWLYGAGSYAMRIWLNPQKMAAVGVTVTDVQNALQENNIDFSAGKILSHNRNFSLVSDTRIGSAKAFGNLIIRDTGGNIIRLRDVARVALGSTDLETSPMRINQENAIDMEVRPLVSANPIKVADEVKKALAKIEPTFPSSFHMMTTYDQSLFLKAAIDESWATLIEAIMLVIIVVVMFLGSVRGALVPIITIPVCVIGVFAVMLLFGFSINVMTLLAIILAIGLVVDDAIVMLENIHRFMEEGDPPMQAAIKGSKEIGFSVIAMTLTLAAVYAPIGFMSGFTATVIREFAFTLAGAVLISGFVALTLSPMMCARILKTQDSKSRYEVWLMGFFEGVNNVYRRFLTQMLRARWLVIVGLCILGLMGWGIYSILPQKFIPKEDLGYFNTTIHAPVGSSIHYMDGYMKQMDTIYAANHNVQSYASFVMAGTGYNFVTLKDFHHRTQTTQQVVNELSAKINAIPGVKVDFTIPDPVRYSDDTTGKDVQIQLLNIGSYKALYHTLQKIMSLLREYPGLTKIDTSFNYDNQVYEVKFNRQQAAALGVSLQDVATTVSTLLSGAHVTDLFKGTQSYPVRVQMNMKDLESFNGLSQIYVRSSNGVMVPLSNLITLKPAVRISNLKRLNRMNSASINADLAPGYDLGDAVSDINGLMAKHLGLNESFTYIGRVEAFMQSSGAMLGLFMMSLIFIYLVLAAQFESFVDPFIILLAVPLCIVGAMATLKITGGSLNLYTNIGLITLVGLITKHGILITQFANARFKAGDNLWDAVRNAAVVRLRPIAMTTFAMVLGALPLALSRGPGSVSHSQIGWVIVGGMILGTFFSLIVVPIAYLILSRLDGNKREIILTRKLASVES